MHRLPKCAPDQSRHRAIDVGGNGQRLAEILSEADALIRLRLREQGLELPHLVVGAPPFASTCTCPIQAPSRAYPAAGLSGWYQRKELKEAFNVWAIFPAGRHKGDNVVNATAAQHNQCTVRP